MSTIVNKKLKPIKIINICLCSCLIAFVLTWAGLFSASVRTAHNSVLYHWTIIIFYIAQAFGILTGFAIGVKGGEVLRTYKDKANKIFGALAIIANIILVSCSCVMIYTGHRMSGETSWYHYISPVSIFMGVSFGFGLLYLFYNTLWKKSFTWAIIAPAVMCIASGVVSLCNNAYEGTSYNSFYDSCTAGVFNFLSIGALCTIGIMLICRGIDSLAYLKKRYTIHIIIYVLAALACAMCIATAILGTRQGSFFKYSYFLDDCYAFGSMAAVSGALSAATGIFSLACGDKILA